MPKQVNSSYLQLFMRESDTAAMLNIEQLPDVSDVDAIALFDWMSSKRSFSNADVSGQRWIKTCSAGYVTELFLHLDGSLEEYTLFNRLPTKGSWKLEQGVLDIEIIKGNNIYQSRVIANKSVNIHSAIEYKNGELHSYLKLAHIMPVAQSA
ncbi:hypothetical protein L4D06_21290 [Enterovibrio makurazakiensis]|uniref:Uncharacterized protein n=1 Tax=Enterovibrio gelatinilyticus TaxID=2899819 RepID=A0ABT5R557_9GAMM|nr:hypothetical protein [Enterovibrio sp. ZSDZ42]MDD1795414.1 hypothetical protein [Enterovibrio sp. ZSDZ42]